MNTAQADWERNAEGANAKVQQAFERVGDILLKTNDKYRNSLEATTRAVERQALVYGKSGTDRLIIERDQLIKKLGDQKDLIDRVTASYAKMIATEQGGAGGNWQAFGRNIQQFVQNPLQAAQQSLGALGGGAAIIGGVTAGVIALGAGAFEAAKSLGE